MSTSIPSLVSTSSKGLSMSKVDPDRCAPPFEIFWGFVFVNLHIEDSLILVNIQCFTMCILLNRPTLITKTEGMCEGASKQTPDLRILPHRDRAPRFSALFTFTPPPPPPHQKQQTPPSSHHTKI